jgi:transcriptional regulator with XRE-family HTH domain
MPVDNRFGATVRLDGAAVRRTREQKSLTQLYVAEVVGVTVDTVSRWENNRTSAVKRENAEALAGALEVALREILREQLEAPAETPVPAPPERSPRRRVILAAGLIACGAAALALFLWKPSVSVRAQRELPAYLTPGGTAPVLVRIRVLSGSTRRVVLREKLPPGWQLVRSTLAPDAGPTPDGLVRWIVPLDGPETLVGYIVRAPA